MIRKTFFSSKWDKAYCPWTILQRSLMISLMLWGASTWASPDPIRIFPLQNYSQKITQWLNPQDANYQKILLSPTIQQHKVEDFYAHYIGNKSPWNKEYVQGILNADGPDNLLTIEQEILTQFNNQLQAPDKQGYAINFQLYPAQWWQKINENVQLKQLSKLSYDPANFAITTDNLPVRALPTMDVFFYDYHLAGQGYPFDNLQVSSMWAGSPVYVLGSSADQAWKLILGADYIGWVKSTGIAYVDENFIAKWRRAAQKQLIVLTKNESSVLSKHGRFLFSAYIGMIFPAAVGKKNQILVPQSDLNGQAKIEVGKLSPGAGEVFPLAFSPAKLAPLIQENLARPYSWGGVGFYSDCSGELKNLLTPFGIWLPRNSAEQAEYGKQLDLSTESPSIRLQKLLEYGKPWLTLIYIDGHVMLYAGAAAVSSQGPRIPMTYQNMWGMKDDADTYRAVIGKTVFFPLLLNYPEDSKLKSPAATNYFKLVFLDQVDDLPQKRSELLNLRRLMIVKN